jgi:hypothetical protein
MISQTVWTNSIPNQQGFPFRTGMNWSCSSLCILTVHCMVSWPLSTLIWFYSPRIGCCYWFLILPILGASYSCCVIFLLLHIAAASYCWYFLFLLHLIFQAICKCLSRFIDWMAALAVSWLTNSCLCHCCVPRGGAVNEGPVGWLDYYALAPCTSVQGAIVVWFGKWTRDDNEETCEVMRNI